jgi:hypothetical protein
MKTFAGLIFSCFLICQAALLRAQDGSIDLGTTSSGDLTLSGGTITISSGGTISSGATLSLNDATIASAAGTLVLQNPSSGTVTNFLATQAGAGTLAFSGTSTEVLSSTVFQNLSTGAATTVVTGGTLTSAGSLTIAASTNSLSLGGTVVVNGALSSAAQLVFPFPSTLVYFPNATLASPTITATALQSNVTAGLNFNLIPALTDFSGLGTTVQLLGGTASVNRAVLTTFSAGPTGAASDDVNVSGTISDTYVLELSYSQAAALALPGGPNAMQLQWLNPNTGQWVNAVDGNTGGTPTFVNGAYNPAVDFNLGTYGVDTTNDVVWAVVDHNSQFAADSQVPEPGSVMLLSVGLTGLLGGVRFRRGN